MRKINTKSKFLALAAMTVIGAAMIWAVNSRVSAKAMPICGSCTARFSFGMLGITSQQTARFSVVNTNKCDAGHTCAPAQIDLRFVDSSGNPFNGDGHQIGSSTVTLSSGQSGFVDFTPSSNTAGRIQIRAEMPGCVGCGNSKGTILATLEVFDTATGKTTLVMPDYPAISSRGDNENEGEHE